MPSTCGSAARRRRGWLVCSCTLGLAVFSGCSGGQTFPMGEVSGTVKYNGQPISLGKITFISTGGAGHFGSGIINDGSYTLQAPLGPCKVEVQIQTDDNKYAVTPQQMKMIKSKMKQMKEQGMNVPEP